MESNTKILNNLIRKDTIAGTPKTIVGDKFSDLVLETLGKVYIKSGRQLNLLSDVINQISQTSENDLKNKTIIVSSLEELNNMEYPGEGYFIFNKTTGILYISLNSRYIALVNASEFSESGYVKKSGDIMTGPLEIKSYDANLIISNNKLIKNLNSSYLNGFTDSDFAKRNKDEKINGNWNIEGKWSFDKPTVFNENIRSKKDYITNGSLSSPEFASGFSGYGWKLDASTNTFTIDNLVVRKLMMVYEMVINKIMATNGSLWVSNSSKIESVKQVRFIYPDYTKYVKDSYSIVNIEDGFDNNEYYLFGESKFVTGENIASSTNIPENRIDKFKPIRLQYLNNAGYNIINFLDSGIFIEDENPEIYDINNDDLLEASFNAIVKETPIKILTYYKYFAEQANPNVNNCYVIETDKEEYPMFRDGDILRCQKYTEGNIKYYDAVVLKHIKERHYLIQVAESVFDKYTKVEYDEKGNLINSTEEYNETLYNKTNKVLNPSTGEYVYKSKSYENTDGSYNGESSLYKPQKGDDLIQIGNIYNTDRQGALYLTATDDQGPYMDILDGINRPDYSVLYKTGDEEYNKPTKVRLGKLDGIYNPIFKEKQPKGYGLYGENVYLTGEFILNNGKSVVEFTEDSIKLAVGDIDQLEKDLESVKEQLEYFDEEFISNDDLDSAGMHIGEDGIILWADAIKIATEKADMYNPNKYTALFSDGKLSAQVFEAVAYADQVYSPKLKINDNIGYLQILGCKGEVINIIKGIPSSKSDIGIYYFEDYGILQFVVDKQPFIRGSNPGLVIGNNKVYDGVRIESGTGTLALPLGVKQITFIIQDNSNITTIDYSELNKNYSYYEYMNPYPTLTINKLGNGETIYYWKSGYVMNCKLFKLSNNTIKGCVEFFFNDNVCTLDFVKEGYDSLILKYTKINDNGEVVGENGCVKYIDYFTINLTDIQLEAVTTYKWKSFDNSVPGNNTYIERTSLVSSDLEKNSIAKTISDLGFHSEAVVYYRILNSDTFTYNGIEYDISNYLYKSSPYTICKKLINDTDIISISDYEEWDSLKVKPLQDVEYVINYTCNRDSSKVVKSGSITSLPVSSNGDLTNGWKYQNYFYNSYILDNIINNELI